jgi:hypothetical protein
LERRVYEIARKHCGHQAEWRIGLDLLLKKCGSNSPRRVFKKMIRDLVEHDHLPDYTVALDDETVVFRNRERLAELEGVIWPELDAETLNDARILAGDGVEALVEEWRRMWLETGAPELAAPGRAFLGFVRKRAG